MQSDTPPVIPDPEKQTKNNTPLIIGIVVVVLLCCCCIGALVFYQYLGDPIWKAIQQGL